MKVLIAIGMLLVSASVLATPIRSFNDKPLGKPLIAIAQCGVKSKPAVVSGHEFTGCPSNYPLKVFAMYRGKNTINFLDCPNMKAGNNRYTLAKKYESAAKRGIIRSTYGNLSPKDYVYQSVYKRLNVNVYVCHGGSGGVFAGLGNGQRSTFNTALNQVKKIMKNYINQLMGGVDSSAFKVY